MKITVNYFGQLRHLAGRDADEVELEEPMRLGNLLVNVAERYGPEFRRIVFDEALRLRPSLIVLVNGAAISKDAPPALKNDDQVTLLPAIAGG